ncbi:MAG: SBBP repeat-containing protein [Deltaproteobacteria bacterium]|nr:SBBP repeat-containing protein [Deltaproteobacteria bacterium]
MKTAKVLQNILVPVLALLLLLVGARPVPASKGPQAPQPALKKLRVPLAFEEIREPSGQRRFLGRGSGYMLLLTPREAVLAYPEKPPVSADLYRKPGRPARVSARVITLQWLGARAHPRMATLDPLQAHRSYYTGNRPEDWRLRVPLFRRVKYENLYPGIDLVFYEKNGRLEYDFVVAPGADPRRIRLAFHGIDRLSLDGKGHLVLHRGKSRVVQRAPVVYQEIKGRKTPVSGRYRLTAGNGLSFEVDSYDPARPLIIDPSLDFLTYLGGGEAMPDYDFTAAGLYVGALDMGYAVALDGEGNVYAAGETWSYDFPRTHLFSYDGFTDPGGFVTKFSPTGEFLASAYFDDFITYDIALDGAGNIYLTGATWSPLLPLVNEYQSYVEDLSYPIRNAFVMKLDPGLTILYSTYLAGHGQDWGYGIAADHAGHAYVTGRTRSTDFPTKNAFMTDPDGDREDARQLRERLHRGTHQGRGFSVGKRISGRPRRLF